MSDNHSPLNYQNSLLPNYIHVKQDHITFSLDVNKKTAGVLSYDPVSDLIFIPRSIEYERDEYVVTRILESSFKNSEVIRWIKFPVNSELKVIEKEAFYSSSIESILIPSSVIQICESAFEYCEILQYVEFAPNSELQIIEKRAFANTPIEYISIPSSVVELQEGWCCKTSDLKKVTIIENNQKNIELFNDNLVTGKSDIKSDIFDVLLFVTRDTKTITIPPFIKKIASYAFSETLITSIEIPSNVTHICEGAFSFCKNLEHVKIPKNSSLQKIGYSAFADTKIESLVFPPNLAVLEDGWCDETKSLNNIEIIPDNHYFKFVDEKLIAGKDDMNNDDFNVLVFACRDVKKATIPTNIKRIASYAFAESNIESIKIPSNVTHICEHAFAFCECLQRVEISKDSKLQIIGKEAFNCCPMKNFLIPPHVIQICEEAFYSCDISSSFEISPNSELQIIEPKAFNHSKIESISIPLRITQISKLMFSWCQNLKKVVLPPSIQIIESKAFYNSFVEIISIFSSVLELKDEWCIGTSKLDKILVIEGEKQNILNYNDDKNIVIGKSDIKNDNFDVLLFVSRNIKSFTIPSFIKKIGSYAFSQSSIESIYIPSNITHIQNGAFQGCNQLQEVNFAKDSKLQIIGEYAFNGTGITNIIIPQKVKKICDSVFSYCLQLKNVEFQENSELMIIEENAFSLSLIEDFSVPSSVTELKDKWCRGMKILDKVTIMPNNPIYKNIDDNLIVGKSDPKSDIYDVLVFASRNIKSLIIPPNIKIISSFVFAESSIESITISPQIVKICEGAFFSCRKLKKVEILKNLELQIIDQIAFFGGTFKSICIPSHLKIIGEDAFAGNVLQIIEIDEHIEIQSFDKRKFIDSENIIVMIPVKSANHCFFI